MPDKQYETLPVLNFNTNPHEKHNVSQKSLKILEKVMLKQDVYGFDKYKKPLSSKMDYNWLDMLTEELADGLKYLQCEMDRKAEIIHLLKMGLRSDVPKEYIDIVLGLLTIEGTGK
jgi:hypothetical protein